MILTETAAAKVNLTLRVLGRRPDGYHELASLVAFAGAGDTLTLEPDSTLSLEIKGQRTALLGSGDDNLVLRAARVAAKAEPRLRLGRFVLDKMLPVAAGLGGGSADAAAALRLIRAANPTLSPGIDWRSLAATIGADVPVCLESRAAMMLGLGERVTPLAAFPETAIVLVNPGVSLATAQVFRALKAAPLGTPPTDTPLPSFAGFDDLTAWARARPNDLEAVAISLCPEVRSVLDALSAASGPHRLVRMSGSGPTCFSLFETRAAAEAAAALVSERYPAWWVRAAALA